jgi:hypothetical protein
VWVAPYRISTDLAAATVLMPAGQLVSPSGMVETPRLQAKQGVV